MLRYAVQMTATPVHVSDEAFDQLKGHFDDRQLVELTSCIAWENYRARFDHAFGVETEGFSEGAFCPAPINRLTAQPPQGSESATRGNQSFLVACRQQAKVR